MEKKKTKKVGKLVWMDEEQNKKVIKSALKLKISQSEFIRKAIDFWKE